jgi:hypothetical protein
MFGHALTSIDQKRYSRKPAHPWLRDYALHGRVTVKRSRFSGDVCIMQSFSCGQLGRCQGWSAEDVAVAISLCHCRGDSGEHPNIFHVLILSALYLGYHSHFGDIPLLLVPPILSKASPRSPATILSARPANFSTIDILKGDIV